MPEFNMAAILQQTARDPAFQRLLEQQKQGLVRSVNIIGPTDAQKAFIALALTSGSKRRPCLLVPDELRARTLSADLKGLTDQPILVFRPRELNLTDAEAVSRESEHKRLAILTRLLAGDYAALVIPAAAALQKIMPRRIFEASQLRLQVGQRLDIEACCRHLLQIGYERMRLVDGPGQFAQRGDIVDVVPASAEDAQNEPGIRLSFFDVVLDSIKEFDLETQRSSTMLRQVALPPARELLIAPGTSDRLAEAILAAGQESRAHLAASGAGRDLIDSLGQLCRRDAERVSAHLSFAGLDRWIALLYPDAESVLDYAAAAGACIFVDEPLRFRNRLDAAQADLDERLKTMLNKGQVLPLTSQAAFRGVDISLRLDRQGPAIALCQIASSGNGLPGADQANINGRAADSYRGREEQLQSDLAAWQAEGRLSLLFAGSQARQARLQGLLLEKGLNCPVFAASLPRGFVWPAAGLQVIGTQDIFGSEHVARRRHQTGIRIDLFSDLVPGEMVVHEAHGIGRYEGLVNLETGGTRRDYLKIVYAGDDTLYIPMESLDQIQKYVGAEGLEPKLSKLGGQEWTRMKERARDSIRKLATDLIRLYAQRAGIKGHQFAADTVWQQEFEENFPFEETEDQVRSIQEIKQDMESAKVMDRLLCGDVGYGKTEVAFRAIFKCVMDGRQAVLLTPTTVLAQQHYDTFSARLAGFPVTVEMLSRFRTNAQQDRIVRDLRQGKVDIII
ncbi:MAG TPA: hypothetical protein DD640_05120, partial [Clostridiales bacterium]|nr:hypothetical protein [Clostridiales bacterium]